MGTFLVVRTFWNAQGQRSNSQEEFPTYNDAKKRFFTILGGDIGKETVSFEIVTILNPDGIQLVVETIDNRVQEAGT